MTSHHFGGCGLSIGRGALLYSGPFSHTCQTYTVHVTVFHCCSYASLWNLLDEKNLVYLRLSASNEMFPCSCLWRSLFVPIIGKSCYEQLVFFLKLKRGFLPQLRSFISLVFIVPLCMVHTTQGASCTALQCIPIM